MVPTLPMGIPPSGPARMLSNKLPKGRHLIGDNVVYDVDVRLPGEVQPQLEVTPITKYGSDPQLVLGRQIAVNKSYICYGLKQGNIRVLNIHTALRSLFRAHTQVTQIFYLICMHSVFGLEICCVMFTILPKPMLSVISLNCSCVGADALNSL